MSETKFTKGIEILPIEDDKEYIRLRGTTLGGIYKVANVIDLKDHHPDNSVRWCVKEREAAMANAHLFKTARKLYAELELLSGLLLSLSFENRDEHNLAKKSNDIDKLLAEARGE